MTAETRSVVVRLTLENAQYLQAALQSGVAMEAGMGKAEAAAKRAELANERVGKAAGRMALVTVAALGAAGKAAIDWEQQWAGVTKTVDGSAEQLGRLEDELRTMATTLPASHQEIAAVAEAAGQLGVKTKDVASFTRTMVDLGETTNLTAEEAATSIAQMQNVLRTAPEDIDNLGATLVALGNNGASTEAQILGMAQRIAGAGAQIGLTEDQILGIANAAASMGLEVEAGGTAISRTFTTIAKAVDTGGPKLETFAQVAGQSIEDFSRSFEEDPARAFAAFIEGLDQINKAGGSTFAVLDQIGLSDVRVSQALLNMSSAGDYLTQSLDLGAQAWAENTALADEAAKRYETTGSQIQIAWNQIRDAGIDAGEVLLPTIATIASTIGDLASAFGALPGPVQTSLVGLAAVSALVSGGTWLGGKALTTMRTFGTTLESVGFISEATKGRLAATSGFLAGPWGAAIAGATILLTAWWTEHVKAEQQVKSFTSSLDAETGAITENTYREAADALGEWRDSAEAAGITGAELIDAVVKGGDAIDVVAEKFEAYQKRSLTSGLWDQVTQDSGDFRDRLGELNEQIIASGEAWKFNEDAVSGYTGPADEAADAAKGHAESLFLEAQAAQEAADSLEEQIQALRDAITETLRARSAEVNYQESILDAKEALKENGKTLDITTRKGQANRRALDDVAASWNELSDQAKNTPGAYRGAIRTFVNLATEMGMGEKAAERLARKILDLPPKREIKVVTDTSQAMAAVDAFKARLDSLRNKTITVTQFNAYKGGPKLPEDFATGGYTGNGGRFEPAGIVHRGEVVIPQPLVKRDWSMLSSRYGHLPGFETGGVVGRTSSGGADISTARATGEVRELARAAGDAARNLREEARERKQAIAQQRADIRSNIAGNLRSDPFANDGNPWTNDTDPIGVLRADIASARKFRRTVRQLRRKGLDGAALASITNLEQAQAIRGLGGRGIRDYERLYRTRQRVSSAAGATLAAGAVGGGDLTETNRRLARLEQAVKGSAAATGREVGRVIRSATREGMER